MTGTAGILVTGGHVARGHTLCISGLVLSSAWLSWHDCDCWKHSPESRHGDNTLGSLVPARARLMMMWTE